MLISVIIPVYNAERFLRKSIESVKTQSYKNIELLLIDDGSTDGSLAICNEYALADNRIKVISQKNSGPAASRNTGLRHATGTFVYFVDAVVNAPILRESLGCYSPSKGNSRILPLLMKLKLIDLG